MGFWGMSQQGKDARNAISGIADEQTRQGTAWNGLGSDAWGKGNEANGWAYNGWKDASQNGAPTIGQNRSAGQQIWDPTSATADDWSRLAQTQNFWQNNVPKAGQTMDQINGNLDNMGGLVGSTWDANQNTIDTGYNGMAGRATDAYNANTGTIKDAYGKAQGDWNTAYDAMGNRVTGAYGGLLKDAASTFDTQDKNLEMLKPGSEFQIAQTARSFAPAMSATAGRLRRAGIDANSLQGSTMLGGVETQRARAMDDAAAAGLGTYVGAKNAVAGNRLNTNIGLTTDQLNAQNGLGTAQAAGNQSMTLGQGSALVGENTRNLGVQNALDQNRMGLTLDNQNQATNAANNVLGLRNQAALTGKDLAQSDFQTFNQMMKDQSAQSNTDLNRNLLQYQLGQQQNAADMAQKNLALQQIGQLGQQQQNAGLAAGQLGLSNQNAAAGLQNNIYSREAANAGWGSKMLLGAGLNLATGGLGGWMSGLGGLTGGSGADQAQYIKQYGGG